MKKENAPTAQTVGGVGSYGLNKFKVADGDQSVKRNFFEFFPGKGIRTYKALDVKASNGGARGTREKIAGWSSASRRRMRGFMLTHQPQNGPPYGVTLTLPGPVLEPKLAKKIFKTFARDLQEKQGAAVWRVEKHKDRDQLHFHLVAALPASELEDGFQSRSYSDDELNDPRRAKIRCVYFTDTIKALWSKAVDSLGVFPELRWIGYDGNLNVFHNVPLSMVPGFDKHGVDVKVDGEDGAWLTYLQDHCTKKKKAQLAVGVGRQWGIIGKASFQRVLPESAGGLSDAEYSRALRWFQRLVTPTRKNVPCVFGSKLGYRIRRGFRGQSDWFSKPSNIAAARRIVEWARTSAV